MTWNSRWFPNAFHWLIIQGRLLGKCIQSFVAVESLRVHFRVHWGEITGKFVECIFSINPSIKREALLLTYKRKVEEITLLRGNQRIRGRNVVWKHLATLNEGRLLPHLTSIPENWTHVDVRVQPLWAAMRTYGQLGQGPDKGPKRMSQ